MHNGLLILNGQLPYLDSWDHKGPILYLFNAIGLIFSKSSPVGIYFIEGVLLVVSLLLCAKLWSRLVPLSLISVAFGLFSFTYISNFESGNLTETWVLPFLLPCFLITAYYELFEKTQYLKPIALLVGVTAAIIFLTRLNNGASLFTLFIYLFVSHNQHRSDIFKFTTIGFVLVSLPVLTWLAINGALQSFYQQYFEFNYLYATDSGLANQIRSGFDILNRITFSPIGVTVFALLFYISFIDNNSSNKTLRLILLFLILFLTDLIAQSLSGKSYFHYNVILLPSLLTLTLLSLHHLKEKIRINNLTLSLCLISFVIVLTLPALSSVNVIVNSGLNSSLSAQHRLKDYMEELDPDIVYVHGPELGFLLTSNIEIHRAHSLYIPTIEDFGASQAAILDMFLMQAPDLVVISPNSCGVRMPPCESNEDAFLELEELVNSEYDLKRDLGGYQVLAVR